MAENKKRIIILDELRGFAIICMIIHHAFLDVGDVLGLEWGYKVFNALCTVQPIFWAIFIIISGICSRLSRNTAKRGALVLGCALAITVVTAIIMPLFSFVGAEIYFGILHCLGICMIITGISMPLIKKINYKTGMAVCAVIFLITYGVEVRELFFGLIELPESLYTTNWAMAFGFHNNDFYSADYFPLIPWLFLFLFGAFAGEYVIKGNLPEWAYKNHVKIFSAVGKHSLWIYLAHQPVIYGIFLLIYFVFMQ